MSESTPARIVKIEVKGLFGLYDHVIPLNLKERVTIVHGPNGVGKTVLMGLVDALLRGELTRLAAVPFSRLVLAMSDGSPHVVVQTVPTALKGNCDLEYRAPSGRIWRWSDGLWSFRLEPGGQEAFTDAEPEELGWLRRLVPGRLVGVDRLNSWVDDPSTDTWGGLLGPPKQTVAPTVKVVCAHLRDRIQSRLADYGRESEGLDRTFPKRAIQKSQGLDLGALLNGFARVEERRAHLERLDLIDAADEPPMPLTSFGELDGARMAMLGLYIEDTEAKLAVLDDLAQRLQVLVDSLNRRLLNKAVRPDRKRGLVITGVNAKDLEPDLLSSGEQHELVLLYELLFGVTPGSLVMIDEPELSLHVDWQSNFLDDMLKIAEVSKIDILLATHSPDIIAGRSDLMVALSGAVK